MNLTRLSYTQKGIFGRIENEDKSFECHSLEHAYGESHDGLDSCSVVYSPLVPCGTYICKRGTHQLKGSEPFETFEVLGVPLHSGILFHSGNTNADSKGCILLGMFASDSGITHSKDAFSFFMESLRGVDNFVLTIK